MHLQNQLDALVGDSNRVLSTPTTTPVREGKRPGILVVDDEDDVRRLLGKALAQHGFEVWLAGSGRIAIDIFRESRESIDVVLLDVAMPIQNGPRTLAELRAIDPRIPACFMTGYAGRYTEEELFWFGVLAIFWKPLHLHDMAEQLKRMAVSGIAQFERAVPGLRT